MSGIIRGYTYDIFISYRQKDNKYDGWVTEFVKHLKGELESTFKEEINVYFDLNSHDGLPETRDDASHKEKLKCLIFIPVISRTYCDPRSFAWEHEFRTFIEQASKDQFGLKVRLPNGNIANRVLPVRIHDLDIADTKLCESLLGGVLRGVEFIYKSPGVNRPLRFKEESPGDNLNKTFYRDQINKVSLAVKEIILGLQMGTDLAVENKVTIDEQTEESSVEDRRLEVKEYPKPAGHKLQSGLGIAMLLVIIATIAYPKIFNRKGLKNPEYSVDRISVAVMPFQNMTNDTVWNAWQEGIQDNLITYLSNYSDNLEVRQTESINIHFRNKGINNYSFTPSEASSVSQRLNTGVFLYGAIKKAGSTIRISAQLFDSDSEEIIGAFQLEDTSGVEILSIIDSLSVLIRDFLVISVLTKDMDQGFDPFISTGSSEAYRDHIYGFRAFFYKGDYNSARKWFLRALDNDSNSVIAQVMISYTYGGEEMYNEAKKWSLKAYINRDRATLRQIPFIDLNYATYFETPEEEINYVKQLLELNNQFPYFYFRLGLSQNTLFQYAEAITCFERSLAIYKKWNLKPGWIQYYSHLGYAYHKSGQYKKEKKLYKKAEHDFPDDPFLIHRQAVLAFNDGDSVAADKFTDRYLSVRKNNLAPAAMILSGLADIYSEAGKLDKAEFNYRKSLSLEPENQLIMSTLAYFLIDKDRNVIEGLELADSSLKISPDNFDFLHTKGWGLYKKGKFQEAFELLQKSWDLRMKNAVYDHTSYLHLQQAKKAISAQN